MKAIIHDDTVVREIEGQRVQVLQKFADFELKAINKRSSIIQSRQLQVYLRSAAEFKQVIESLIESSEAVVTSQCSESSIRGQKVIGRLQQEADGKHNNLPMLENEAARLLKEGHYASDEIQKTFNNVLSRWEYLLKLLALKWRQLEKEIESIEFKNKCDSIVDWILKIKESDESGKEIFDEIRKCSMVWNEISATFQQMLDPTATDTSNYEKVHETWSNFQEYIDSLHKKLSENERFQKFVDNAEDLIKWMDDKEKEICEKYSKMDFEVMMKYRKTVEIEMKSVEQRIKDLKEQFVGMENDNLRNIPDPKNHVIDVEQRFESFQAFVQKWKTDIENSADADKLMKEAENICCWSSEKIEDLKIMATSDTPDCDEIIMWIETNNFDFNSWDNVVVQFLASSQELLNKQNNGNVKQEVERTTELYELAKRTMKTCNEFLEDRIQTINMEKLIFQTHQKAVILASFLQNHEESPEDMNAEDIEKEIRVIDGITVRCTSVVEQIENIEDELRQKPEQLNQLSVYASKQVNDLNEMKEVLKTTVNSRKAILQRLLDVTYFLDNCCETRKHTDTMLSNVKSSRVKLEIVQPIKDQLDSLKVEMVDMMLDDQQKNMANEELRKTYENLKKIEMEVGRQASQKEARKAADRTEAFVGRVQNWIDNNQIQDDTDIVSETVNLRRTTTHYQHLLSICASYKKSIDSKLEELANVYTDNDPRCLLEGIQNSVENFEVKIHQKVDDTKKLLHITENMNELNSQNEWIRAKIKSLSAEPLWDSLLIAQKMRRRHDNDFEEIANRRKQITEVIQKSATTKDQPILLEIEQNWDRMKDLFDERGGVLERIIKLYEYDEESSTTSEWLREKMICADTIEPKEDESFNEVMVKKLEALTEEVENYKPRIVETHALLEDALVTPNTKDSTSQQTMKLKAVLARKQGEIESDYKALKKLVERKLKTLKAILQDADISHQIADIEQWIEVEQNQLNRYLASDSDELPTKLDDVMTNIQRRRSNLTDIKCNVVGQVQMQKIDDAFGMLDVFSFEVHRIRQKACRLEIFKKLESQTEDVIDAIQMKLEEINVSQSTSRKRQVAGDDLSNLAGDLETLRRRVVEALDRSKEVRAANADLAPQVYDTEERLEKQWTDVSKAYENHKKRMERCKILSELDNEMINMEQWIDTFNEEVTVVIGSIHDGLGVQVGLESIDTWREELSHRVDQLGGVKNSLSSVGNAITEQDKMDPWLERVSNIENNLVKARETIDTKQDDLCRFADILGAERDCERLYSWASGKRHQLETEATMCDAKTLVRRMNEVEKMMMSRIGEVDQLRDFLDNLKASKTSDTFQTTELENKFELLDVEWNHLEEELRRREVDLNDSMSQILIDEQFDTIRQWIKERTEALEADVEVSNKTKPDDIERMQKRHDELASDINDYHTIYEDFLNNGQVEEEKVQVIRHLWSSLIESSTTRQKSLAQECQKSRLFELLDGMSIWLIDAETDVHSTTNFIGLYNSVDAEKASRLLVSLGEQAGEKDDILIRIQCDESVDVIVEKLRNGISQLQMLIKANNEDLDVWKSMQKVVTAIDDEICWFKEINVIFSSTNVGNDVSSNDVLKRKHQRLQLETQRREQKVAKVVYLTTELVSSHRRPSLEYKFVEIDEKVAELTELLESNRQIAEIRTNRLEKWTEYFVTMNEIREKEQLLDQILDLKTGLPETVLADVERKLQVLETVGDHMDTLTIKAEQMSDDEVIRTKVAVTAIDQLRKKWLKMNEELKKMHQKIKESIEFTKFVSTCDTGIQCIREQEEKIGNLVRHQKPASNFENTAYHSTMTFVETYTKDTFEKLKVVCRKLQNSTDAEKKLSLVSERLNALKKQLDLLAEKIAVDDKFKLKVQNIQDEYSRTACELGNWLEQAEEDVSDVVWFQTKDSSEDCRETLLEILGTLRNEKSDLLGELELLEVELAELKEDVKTFTWHSFKTLATRMERLDQTISDRIRIADGEISRHSDNEKICEQAACTLKTYHNVIVDVKKELEILYSLKLEDQKKSLINLIDKVQKRGMIQDLEKWRSLMESRYIFNNKFSSATPHGVLVEMCQCLELMSSMLRSVEQSIADRNHNGVTEKQLHEFELAFDYFDRERNGWLDYKHFELCLKSQGYNFSAENTLKETMTLLDPSTTGHIQKHDYVRYMVKHETTNILDDHSAIEDALKNLDARKISDSMPRKEAEFFMSKIAKHAETSSDQVYLEYKDFVNSFY